MVGAPLKDSVRLELMGDLITVLILLSCLEVAKERDCMKKKIRTNGITAAIMMGVA